jgi:membrane peptidoglycan carboxypeptidase
MINLQSPFHSERPSRTSRYLRKFSKILGSHRRLLKSLLIIALCTTPFIYEMRTSAFSSWILSNYAKKLSYKVQPGPSPNIVFPKHGPFDIRAGYALIPEFARRLQKNGYRITEQARFSPELQRAARWGIIPPYPEPTSTKLTVHGSDGQPLFRTPVVESYFTSFEEIPSLAVKGLLIIENRELDEPADYRTNPVVDWERLAKAVLLYAGNKLGLPLSVEGGSTLATQMEKFKHSDDGRTDSVLAKLRQMTDASLKVYQNGTDTREDRRQILLNYLNSIPLAATPGYGEIHGIGNGLNAWFGFPLQDVQKSLAQPDDSPEKARIFKHVLALLCSVRAPSYYLVQNHKALEARVDFYARFLAKVQVISPNFSRQIQSAQISFAVHQPKQSLPAFAERKAANEIRSKLALLLGVPGMYELDRLHLDIETTIDPTFQNSIVTLFEKMHDPQFLVAEKLQGERLLAKGDPSKVIYGIMLFEKTPQGNLLRSITDNLNAPFDINTGMKMQLGSTAKLRVLSNYLDIASSLYTQHASLSAEALKQQQTKARDPITQWALEILTGENRPDLDQFLQLALDRKYSAHPGEMFFTGGGIHTFSNFQKSDNGRVLPVRDATKNSVNLVYVRLMRDIVRYYEARLPYDTDAVLSEMDNPIRRKLLQEISEEESKIFLSQAYTAFKKRTPEDIIAILLGKNATSARHLAITFYAWRHGWDQTALTRWLESFLENVPPEKINGLQKSYSNPLLTLSDYGYLLGIHPLRLWCAGKLATQPELTWEQLWEESEEARTITATWLLGTKNRSAQDRRLRIRFEQDAFIRMTPTWKRLGFPFDRLVPSLATALGSSGDRPESLAQLMGILLNDGYLKPTIRITRLHFADNTPYETTMEPANAGSARILSPAVARAILPVLAQVVQAGTAARAYGAVTIGDKMLTIGGKTGSGDNRIDEVGRRGARISSRPMDRTATFVFYIENRYFGVITAFVPGSQSGEYGFTSSLPVAILRLLAPDIRSLWIRSTAVSPPHNPEAANASDVQVTR